MKLTDKKEVEGLPGSVLGMGSEIAKSKGEEKSTPEEGPWVYTLDGPPVSAIMKTSSNRALREKMYKAFCTKASD